MRGHYWMALLTALVLFFAVAGCSGDSGGNDLADDPEFNEALEQIIANEISSEEVVEQFSDRYDPAEIIDAIKARLEEAKAEIEQEKQDILEGEVEEGEEVEE